MKNSLTLACLLLLLGLNSNAQDSTSKNGMGFGFHLLQYQDDFGMGVNLVSPYFVNQKIGIRLKANLMYNQNVIDGITEWIPYANVSLGIIGLGGYVSERIRLYGEGGVLLLFPPDKLSSQNVEVGSYGLFGFEFFFSDLGNYFIEIGGVGTGAKADKIEASPIYSNGLTIGVGLRYFLSGK